MKARRVCLTGMLCVWLGHAGEAKNCPSGAIAWVESVTASATRVKTGAENKEGCEDPPCVTQRYQTTKVVTTKSRTHRTGKLTSNYSHIFKSKHPELAVALGASSVPEETHDGHYSADYKDGATHIVCPDTTFNVPNPSLCQAYILVENWLPGPNWMTSVPLMPCPATSLTTATDIDWVGSSSATTTTYEDPITDAMLKGEVEKAIPEPSSQGPWGGGASSSYDLSIHQNLTGVFVKGSGSRCLYRFKVAGTESGTQYEILWDVWEQDPEGLRLFKSEKTSFTGTGKKFQYVAGRTLDVPEWDAQDCQTGGAVQFIKMESIRVEIHEADPGDEEE